MYSGNLTGAQFLAHPIEIVDDYTIRYKTSQAQPITGGVIDTDSTGQPLYEATSSNVSIVHVGNSSIHGDNLRDKYATVMLLNNSEEVL